MLKKLIIIGFIIIVTLSGIFIYFIQSSHNNLFPPEYHSIHEFENSAGVKIYKILDCGQFIEENQQVLLQDVSKPLLLSTHGIEHKNEMTYDISVENCFYRVDINIPDYREINNSIINKTNLGTIYQYNSKEGHEETLIYTNTAIYRNDYVKVEVQYSYTDKNRDMKEVQEKMVEYYQLFEDMNKDEFDKSLKKE